MATRKASPKPSAAQRKKLEKEIERLLEEADEKILAAAEACSDALDELMPIVDMKPAQIAEWITKRGNAARLIKVMRTSSAMVQIIADTQAVASVPEGFESEDCAADND